MGGDAERGRRGGRADVVALAFDVYGTLADPARLAEPLAGVVADPVGAAASWRRRQLELSWLLSLLGRYEDFETVTRHALALALAEEGVELEPARIDALVAGARTLELYPDVAPALAELDEHGFALAVLSNGSRAMLEQLLRAAGVRERFREVVSVDEVRVYKPAPAVYLHAAKRLGCLPGELWLVSANGWDAAGAKNAGLRVARVERVREPRFPFADPPDVVVPTLAELASALPALGR